MNDHEIKALQEDIATALWELKNRTDGQLETAYGYLDSAYDELVLYFDRVMLSGQSPTPEPPAQPQFSQAGKPSTETNDRLWLAGMAMQGLLASGDPDVFPRPTEVAVAAISNADTLLDYLKDNPRPE